MPQKVRYELEWGSDYRLCMCAPCVCANVQRGEWVFSGRGIGASSQDCANPAFRVGFGRFGSPGARRGGLERGGRWPRQGRCAIK